MPIARLAARAVALTLCCVLLTLSASSEDCAVYYSHKTDTRRIALTFDDGPHYKYTAEILDILAEYDVKATFFVVGELAERYPELILRELADGHEVGNHTWSHPRLSRLTG